MDGVELVEAITEDPPAVLAPDALCKIESMGKGIGYEVGQLLAARRTFEAV